MAWNYRILAKPYSGKTLEDSSKYFFQIHEVFYDKDGKPNKYTEKPIPVCGDTTQSIKFSLGAMKKSLEKPILHYGDRFPEEYKK